ncbi:hypothetical protein, partial [Phocaeicola dorei]|uniref:hypothetical protein n=1 Tax=Phocaeicola dorei TaxID=357276 RepID=UPI001BDE28C1
MNPSGFYVDPIFSIALLLDESFLNISIKKAVPPKEIQLLYVIPLRFERKTHALEGLQVQSLFITDLQAIITYVKKNADKPFD